MLFTYNAYEEMLNKLSERYQITDYDNWNKYEYSAILRHDIDTDIEKAVKIAELERQGGVKATYFILLTSKFYNVFSYDSVQMIKYIMECGHEIGLHFDEKNYPQLFGHPDEMLKKKIKEEIQVLSLLLNTPVRKMSYHRPSKEILDIELTIPGIVNSYSNIFFRQFKYISDSRRNWREPVMDIISEAKYHHLHILTHAFWYHENELSAAKCIENFVNRANKERYIDLRNNIRDIESLMPERDVR